MPATGWRGGQTSVQRPTPSPYTENQWGKSFYRQKDGPTCRNSTVTSYSHLQTGHWGLTSIILIVLDTVNLQFQGPFVPISLQSVLRIEAAQVQVQSGHHGVNSSTWCSGIYKTAHRIRLRILSIALEKELNVLGCS